MLTKYQLAGLKSTAEELDRLIRESYSPKVRREMDVLFSFLGKAQHQSYSAGDFEQLAEIENILRTIVSAGDFWWSLNKTESHNCWDHARTTPKKNSWHSSTVCSVCREILCVS